MKYLLPLLFLLPVSCVMPGHLEAIQRSVAGLEKDLQDETLTQAEKVGRIQETVASMQPVVDDAAQRMAEVGSGLWGIAKGNPVEALMAAVGLVGSAVVSTNKLRDRKRQQLGADYVPGQPKA